MNSDELYPLFFYHIPKTGGLSFYGALARSIGLVNRYPGRMGVPWDETDILRLDEKGYHRSVYRGRYVLVGTHLPFGLHQKFIQKFKLVTIVRDPVGRVRSDYTYTAHLNDGGVSSAGFAEFFRREENINRCTKQLSGQGQWGGAAAGGLANRAIENLERDFSAYVTHKKISAVSSFYLTYYHLPNVVMDTLNVTPPEYMIDPEPFRDEILSLNREDQEVYEFVQGNPRIPQVGSVTKNNHPVSLIIKNQPHGRLVGTLSFSVATSDLIRYVSAHPGDACDLNVLLGDR